ncbi:arylesterase [Flavihumibacter fluvii]|uniref:arylesterase n=1 Tax=Flavihumibacter fluvii TaxID=2838157 RepID=UPI001BDF5AB7|nr:arylesterase [Flavihumibacter fluvii]ULQ51581.1 arylesterase [Flavihumibacter fluvii]
MPRNSLIYLFVVTITIWACGSNDTRPAKIAEKKVADTTVVTASSKTILFFGNSLTAGYGLEQAEAFPALILHKIDSLQLPYTVINAGLSGETSSGGLGRIDWLIRQNVDVFVLELGANDGLRGIPLVETQKNLQAIIDKVKAKNPAVVLVLAGMEVPPNMGKAYTTEFRTMYKNLAVQNKMILVPFLLKGVGGNPELNQADGIHPTAEGHKIVANNLWEYLKPVVK